MIRCGVYLNWVGGGSRSGRLLSVVQLFGSQLVGASLLESSRLALAEDEEGDTGDDGEASDDSADGDTCLCAGGETASV